MWDTPVRTLPERNAFKKDGTNIEIKDVHAKLKKTKDKVKATRQANRVNENRFENAMVSKFEIMNENMNDNAKEQLHTIKLLSDHMANIGDSIKTYMEANLVTNRQIADSSKRLKRPMSVEDNPNINNPLNYS